MMVSKICSYLSRTLKEIKMIERIEADEIQPERFKKIIYKDAITDDNKSVVVVDERNSKVYTEEHINEQLAYWQEIKDEIIDIKK